MSADQLHARESNDVVVDVPAPAPAVEGPAAPVPMTAAPTLVVGHAEDHAEADADRRADQALGRLARTTAGAADAGGAGGAADAHRHGPGCDHVRRSASLPPAGAAVGYAGGAVPDAAADRIERLRGSGQALPATTRSQMEGAFGASFSGVRIHTGPESAKLNRLVSARAFTTGRDVFFGEGEFAPDSPDGQRTLAHELAHTLQGGGAVHRLGFFERAKLAVGLGSDQERSTWEADADQAKRQKAAAAAAKAAQKENDARVARENAEALAVFNARLAASRAAAADAAKREKKRQDEAKKKQKEDAAKTKAREATQKTELAGQRATGTGQRAAGMAQVVADPTARGPKDQNVAVSVDGFRGEVQASTGEGAKKTGDVEKRLGKLFHEALAEETRQIDAESAAAGSPIDGARRQAIFEAVWAMPVNAEIRPYKPTRSTADERQIRANNAMVLQEETDALAPVAASQLRIRDAVRARSAGSGATPGEALGDIDVDQIRNQDRAVHPIAPPVGVRKADPEISETEEVVTETAGAVHEAGLEPATAALGLAGAVKDHRVNSAPKAPAPEAAAVKVPDAATTGADTGVTADLATDAGTGTSAEVGKDGAKDATKDLAKDGAAKEDDEDYVSKESEVAEGMGLLKDAITVVYDIIDAGRRVYDAYQAKDSGSPDAKLEMLKAGAAAVQTATSAAKTATSIAGFVSPALKSVVGKIVPGFNIALAIESIIAAGFQLKEVIRSRSSAATALLEARAGSVGGEISSMVGTLVHAVDALDLQLSRAIADAATSVVSVISSIGSVVALPLAAVVEAGNSVVGIAAKVAHMIVDENRARAAQRANTDGALALEGAARDKLRKDPKSAALSLIQNARTGNLQARAVLKSCRISDEHLRTLSITELVALVLKMFGESGDPMTLVQKIEALGDKIGAYLKKPDAPAAPAPSAVKATVRSVPPPRPPRTTPPPLPTAPQPAAAP